MKKLTNNTFKITLNTLEQDASNNSIRVVNSKTNTTLFEVLEPLIRTNDGQGFTDIKIMKERMEAIMAIEGVKENESIIIENSIFNTIAECGKKFKAAFISKEIIELVEYLNLMVSNPDKFNTVIENLEM